MRLLRILPAFFMVLCVAHAAAQEAPPSAPAKIDAEAQKVLDRVKQTFGNAPSRTYSASASVRMEAEGMARENATQYTVAAKQPDKMVMKCVGGRLDGLVLIVNGQEAIIHSATVNKFRRDEAPGTLEGLAAQGVFPPDPLVGFVGAFAETNPVAALLEGADTVTYVGKETIDGVETDRLRGSVPDMEWDLWVRTGDQALPLRLTMDVSKSLPRDTPEMARVKLDMSVQYSDWSLNAELPDERFAFTPAEGAQEVTPPQHPLLGKPAPGFTLKLLDGSEVSFAQHEGKDIVILDLWATWCPACRETMPAVEKVAREFKDKNVVLYAVNQGEDPALVREYIETVGMDAKVALDPDHSLSNLFQTEGALPFMVIIGKDGAVQLMQRGMPRDVESRLRKQIATLVEGKNLFKTPKQ